MMRALLGIVALASLASLAPAAEPIKVDVAFSGVWRVPETSRATIKEWEWDGGGPGTVDVDVTVAAGIAIKEPVEVSYQYEAKGRLTAPKTIVRSVIDLAPDSTQVLHGSINVMDYISHTHRPKFVRVTTRIGKRPPTTTDLPFVFGD
jgi:hypothetical protein